MKKLGLFLLVGGLLCGAATIEAVLERKSATLLNAFDLDGEAADADQIVTAANGDLLDSKTFTVTASPDVCRLVDMTVTDANSSITSGVVTIVGTDCLDRATSCTFDFSVVATRGSGVKTLAGTQAGGGCYLKTVTSVTTGVLATEGGAGVDLMTLGYTSNSANGWGAFGKRLVDGAMGEGRVDPFQFYNDGLPVTTAGVLTTTVTGVSSNNAFTNVVAGDLVTFVTPQGENYQRRITARASANSVTVNSAVRLPATGTQLLYQHLYYSSNPYDQVGWINVGNWNTVDFTWSVDANANTGGVVTSLQCMSGPSPDAPSGRWVEVNTTTVASAATQADTMEAIDLEKAAFSVCRFGLKFGTGDDADAAAEDINAEVTLWK